MKVHSQDDSAVVRMEAVGHSIDPWARVPIRLLQFFLLLGRTDNVTAAVTSTAVRKILQ